MKKILAALLTVLVLCTGTAFAAPMNDLGVGSTAIGYMFHSTDPDSHTLYLEHKLVDKVTVGLQIADIDKADDNETDLYGQLHFTENFRGILGVRDYGPDSNFFIGAAMTGKLARDLDGYASFITADDFDELQIGVNYKLTYNLDLNLNYKNTSFDGGSDRNGVGMGFTYKF